MWGKAIWGKAVDEGGRRARICLSICLGAAAAGVLAAPFAGPLRPVVLAVSGAVVLIFGVSAWAFWGHSVRIPRLFVFDLNWVCQRRLWPKLTAKSEARRN